MNAKNLIRAVIIVAVLAWPAYETYRLQVARQQASANQQLAQSIQQKLAQMKQAHVEIAARAKAKP